MYAMNEQNGLKKQQYFEFVMCQIWKATKILSIFINNYYSHYFVSIHLILIDYLIITFFSRIKKGTK